MLTCIKGIGEKTKLKFIQLGIFTPYDLIFTPPKNYIDLSKTLSIDEAFDGCYCKTDVRIMKIHPSRKKGKLQIFKAEGTSGKYIISLLWFNQNYVSNLIVKEEIYTFYGKIDISENNVIQYTNPAFERKTIENSRFQGIQPIYRTKGILSQKLYAEMVKKALTMGFEIETFINSSSEEKHSLMQYLEAINEIHSPSDFVTLERAQKRIIIEKIVKRLAAFLIEKNTINQNKDRIYKDVDTTPLIESLEFDLSESQSLTVKSLKEDLLKTKKLNAMLCGDVGSGKTIVAFICSYFIVKNGYQAAIMAPTEILAAQHYKKAKEILSPFGVEIALLTSSTPQLQRQTILNGLKKGSINILIGTHSILNAEVNFANIAFVAIDEQQRFGVSQRTLLSDKVENCDTLTLTATPIPRSLQLVAYGEIDYYTIAKRYENNVSTHIVGEDKREEMLNFIVEECKKGKQAFIVAPMIEDSEGCEGNSVKALYSELSKGVFKEIKVAYLHGKLKEQEKQDILQRFAEGKMQVIISTTVIEVGIDVPNVPIMVIMKAERFGLSSLHQLRGRIGRGGKKAYCFLYTNMVDSPRLEKLKSCNNGFEIAEFDYAIRGSGDIFGVEQSGKEGLEGLCRENIELAKDIVRGIDLTTIEKKLKGEIQRHNLKVVSMS